MKNKNSVVKKTDTKVSKKSDATPLKKLSYPAKDDIYAKSEETDIDPENTSKKKTAKPKAGANEKNPMGDITGNDLDIPGSELDDEQEDIGNEDEENNLYSFGGDDNSGLEEDQGN